MSEPIAPYVPSLNAAPTKAIRDAYGEALAELGTANPDVVVLEADVGTSSRSSIFEALHPNRYFNVGIAEGNMMAMSAGFAACGKIAFANTFAVFATLRAADPLRSLVAHSGLNVKIAAAYSGLSDSYDGATHQSVEDLAIVRAIPNIAVVVPADAVETAQAVKAAAAYPGPVYLRLSRAPVPILFDESHPFEIGRGVMLRDGCHVTLIACGYMVHKALRAADILERWGIRARLLEIHTLKPLDAEMIVQAAQETHRIVTIEEHSVYGGLGSAVAELLAQRIPVPMRLIGIPDRFGESGEYEAILAECGLDSQDMARNIYRFVRDRID